ncbi:MAG TPA: hypothetical protein VKL40_09705 [Candidatus Angelobacter sp.]|nr:hypothetical protein [Candidatus Angelobacter sp.]
MIEKDGAKLIYYQPQINEWKDYKKLSGRMAFALTPAGGKEVMGVASLEADTKVDKETRTAYINDLDVKSVRFPSLDPEASKPLADLFKKLVPNKGEPISVDRLLADLDKGKTEVRTVALDNNPPKIFFSASPAILLIVDGKPVLSPIEKTDLQFVVNTNWNLFFDKSEKKYYLLVERQWLTANEASGPWSVTQTLPKEMSNLPENQNWGEVKKMVPPPPPSGTVPQVFFNDGPAELILVRGAAVYAKIPKTSLFYVTNTDNDVFLYDKQTQKDFYVLLSGRWFRAKALGGPWTFASDSLPEDFAKIPRNSPKAHVLASVPGTQEAADAVMLAQIPTTAIVNKAQVESQVKVSYDGDPQFKPIEGTSLQYAANTEDKVIKVGDLYYLCFQGVWFMSSTPNGPWKTADSVPKEIYNIPPSSPVYNVTYVTQTNADDDHVECSYTGGYLGMFAMGMATGAVIGWGTGYYYPPYVYWGGGVPVYRAYPYSYGVGYRGYYGGYGYGTYGASRAAYGPYGAAGSTARYNSNTGTYSRAGTAQGAYGSRSAGSAYNPATGARGVTRQSSNAYAQWGGSAAVRGDQWARTGHVTTDQGTLGGVRSSAGSAVGVGGANGRAIKSKDNVYAGNDGNVYRKNSNGTWSQYNNGNWNQVSSNAREQASQRAQERAGGDRTGQLPQGDRAQASQKIQERAGGDRASQLPQGDRSQAAQRAQQSGGQRANVSRDTYQGLNNAAQSRQRGQAQTQQFQRSQRSSGGRSGGMRSGGRGGGRRR